MGATLTGSTIRSALAFLSGKHLVKGGLVGIRRAARRCVGPYVITRMGQPDVGDVAVFVCPAVVPRVAHAVVYPGGRRVTRRNATGGVVQHPPSANDGTHRSTMPRTATVQSSWASTFIQPVRTRRNMRWSAGRVSARPVSR
jgi:hypothetical protein